MAASERVDFATPIHQGEMVELAARVSTTGRSSVRVDVELWAENLFTAERRHAATARFTMVSVDATGRPAPVWRPSRTRAG